MLRLRARLTTVVISFTLSSSLSSPTGGSVEVAAANTIVNPKIKISNDLPSWVILFFPTHNKVQAFQSKIEKKKCGAEFSRFRNAIIYGYPLPSDRLLRKGITLTPACPHCVSVFPRLVHQFSVGFFEKTNTPRGLSLNVFSVVETPTKKMKTERKIGDQILVICSRSLSFYFFK